MEFSTILFFGTLVSSVCTVKAAEKMTDLPTCNYPAIYNFGDSNSDTGGIAAAFYPMAAPCGETYFHRPAGRGSDGRLIIDFIRKRYILHDPFPKKTFMCKFTT